MHTTGQPGRLARLRIVIGVCTPVMIFGKYSGHAGRASNHEQTTSD